MVKHSHPKEIRDEFSHTHFSNSIIEPMLDQLRTLELQQAGGKTWKGLKDFKNLQLPSKQILLTMMAGGIQTKRAMMEI